jgi:hypothetical protein
MLGWKRRSRVSCAFAVVGLLAAGSQTALLAVVVAVCCVLMVRLLKAISVQYRPVLASFGTVAVLVLAWLVMAHALTVPTLPLSADDLTLTKRTMIWQQLSGGGVPSLGLGGDGLAARIAATIQVGSAHNMWLETWLRDGVPGVVALVIAVLALVIVACRGTDSGLALGGAAMLLVEGMTESSPVHPIFFPFFVALVALPVTLPSKTVTVASVSQETLRMPQVAAQ